MGERLRSPECCIEVNFHPNLPDVLADADALETAILNLLDNAIKCTSADKRISLYAYAEESCVALSVADKGIGIALPRAETDLSKFLSS